MKQIAVLIFFSNCIASAGLHGIGWIFPNFNNDIFLYTSFYDVVTNRNMIPDSHAGLWGGWWRMKRIE